MVQKKWIDLNQRVVIITDGSYGIGSHIVNDLIEKNDQVVVSDIKIPDSASCAAGVDDRLCDIIYRIAFKQCDDDVYRRYQCIDELVNNAVINRTGLLADYYSEMPQYELSDDGFYFMVGVN